MPSDMGGLIPYRGYFAGNSDMRGGVLVPRRSLEPSDLRGLQAAASPLVRGWANMAAFVHITGASGSTAFYENANAYTCTPVGNAQVSTALGFPTLLLDGSGDRVDVAVGTAWGVGAGNLWAGFDCYLTSVKNCILLDRYSGVASTSSWIFQLNTSGQIQLYCYSGGSAVVSILSPVNTILAATRYRIEGGRFGTSTWQLRVNDVVVGSDKSSAALNLGPTNIEIGGNSFEGASWSANGHMWGVSVQVGA